MSFQVREQFGENSTMRDLPTLSYLDVVRFFSFFFAEILKKECLSLQNMNEKRSSNNTLQVDFIAFTGLECLEKATLGQYDEIGEIVHKSIEYLEDGIPRSWSGGSEGQKLYWVRRKH